MIPVSDVPDEKSPDPLDLPRLRSDGSRDEQQITEKSTPTLEEGTIEEVDAVEKDGRVVFYVSQPPRTASILWIERDLVSR